MKLKILVFLSVFVIPFELISLHKTSPLRWDSLLYETPETYEIAALLKVYNAYDDNGPVQLRRIGSKHDGGYVVPEVALQKADVVMGYGISMDISFEDCVTEMYGKPSFGFDCTSPGVAPRQKDCHFIPSCIVSEGSNAFSMSGTFEQHLSMIGAVGKNLFVKMDIEGNEYETMPDILQHASKITGIVLEIHFRVSDQIAQALELLQMLNRDFLLVHVHGNSHSKEGFFTSNSRGVISRVLELSYINRSLVHRYEISSNQTHPTSLDKENAPRSPDVTFTILP